MGRLRLVWALAIVCCWAGGAAAQQPGFTFGGLPRSPKFPMFMDPAVRKELAFTPEQEKKAREVLEEFMGNQEQMEGGRVVIRIGADGAGGVPAMPDFKKIESELTKLLDDKQKARFKQLWLQRSGLMALADDETAKELGLKEEQRDIVKDITEHHGKEMQKMMQEAFAEAGGGQIHVDQKKTKELKEKTEAQLAEILSKEQDEKWKSMLGPKWEPKRG